MLKNLKAELVKKGIEQQQIAKAVNVTYPTFSKWVHGHTSPTVRQAQAVAKYLGSTVDYLFEE